MLNTESSFSYFRPGNQERIDFSEMGWEELLSCGYLIAGSPDTVAANVKAQMQGVGAEHFMGMFHIGNMAHADVMASLELFSREVMPQLVG